MVLLLLFVIASCSSKKKEAYHGSMDESIELSELSTDGIEGDDLDEISEDGEDSKIEVADSDASEDESDNYVVDADEVEDIEEGDEENQDLMVVDVEGQDMSEGPSDELLAEENSSEFQEESITLSEEISEYTVKKGDTLMQIAFKLYGDFGKWKKLKELNPDIDGALELGSIIKYNIPESKFEWAPKGNPYLVMRGDTLGSISQSVYNRASWWTYIHENNKPMIKDPDQIFAGFTLYYLPKEEVKKKRGLASK
jgi:nucleoid-associated protein YgaU